MPLSGGGSPISSLIGWAKGAATASGTNGSPATESYSVSTGTFAASEGIEFLCHWTHSANAQSGGNGVVGFNDGSEKTFSIFSGGTNDSASGWCHGVIRGNTQTLMHVTDAGAVTQSVTTTAITMANVTSVFMRATHTGTTGQGSDNIDYFSIVKVGGN